MPRAAMIPGLRAAVLVLTLLPSATAFEMSDPVGDDTLKPGGLTSPSPSGADLRGLTITEDEQSFTFALDAGNLDDPNEGPLDMAVYRIHVTFNDKQYQLVWTRFVTAEPALQPSLRATWQTAEGEVLKALAWEVPLTAAVPRALIMDSTGAIPANGADLTEVFVEGLVDPASILPQLGTTVTAQDRMPDAGTATVPSLFGPVSTGSMRATARQAFRSSNGGAETFLYLIDVTGGAGKGRIEAESVPEGWTLHLPDGEFDTGGGTIPLLLETAFFHAHGRVGIARLRVTDGTNVARLDIGINYVDPSRPDGHHSTLYFHSGYYTKDAVNDAVEMATGLNAARDIWFNTNEEDAADEGVPVSAGRSNPERDGVAGYGWYASLAPALRDGIHFANGTGAIRVPVRFPAATPAALYGNLSWVDSSGSTLLATITPEAVTQLQAGQVTTLRGLMTASERRFEVGEESGELRLRLLVESDDTPLPAGPDSQPQWEPGGSMDLPLYDYHPPVQDQLADATGMRLTAPTDVTLRPGSKGVLVPVLSPAIPYRLDAMGAWSEWATVEGEIVVLATPADAAPGDFGEVVLRATAADDPLRWAIARVRIAVGDSDSLPTPTAESVESPGVAIGLLVLLCFALARVRR